MGWRGGLKRAGLAFCVAITIASGGTLRAQIDEESVSTKGEFPIWPGVAPGSEGWKQQEFKSLHYSGRHSVIRNVVRPTLIPHLPDPAKANGMAVIVVPGSKMASLATGSEGVDVAKQLKARGIAAFILKYRIVDSGTTPDDLKKRLQSMLDTRAPGATIDGGYYPDVKYIVPLATADLAQAIAVLRRDAAKWRIDPHRIGVIGFSSGALLVNGVLTGQNAAARPDFAAGVHGYTVDPAKVPANAPPLFIACANDDQDMPATNCSSLYDAWHARKLSAELHIYSEGGHDFNMRPHGTPSDSWMDRYFDWLGSLFRKKDAGPQ